MLDLSKKIISYVVIFSLVFSFSTFAYADDTESELTGDTPVSSETVSEEDFNEQLYLLSKNVASLQASNSDVTYTTDDIYLLLQQMFNYNFNQQNASLTFRIYNSLLQTNLNFTTLFTKIDSINSKLTNEDDTLNIYDLCGDMFEQIINHLTVSVGDNIYNITDVCILIEDRIASVQDSLTTIESMLATLNNTSQAILSVCNTISNTSVTIATNTANTITAINNLENTLSDINWSSVISYNFNNSYIKYYQGNNYQDISNYITPSAGQSISNLTSEPVYIIFKIPNSITNGILYKFELPFGGQLLTANNHDVFIYDFNSQIKLDYKSQFFLDGGNQSNYSYLYLYLPSYSATIGTTLNDNAYYVIKIVPLSSHQPLVFQNKTINVKRVSRNYLDTYQGIQLLANFNTISNTSKLDKFVNLYASDDLIKAKDAQQPLEDQVLQDFTGNGSASAKLSDAASAKDTSSALKSGLNTGYSAGDALSVFNSFQASDFGFFAWFSPENATYFNNNTNKNLLKSNMGVNDDYTSIVWTDSVPDVITDIDNDYSRGMK